jgi:hypothetical protein
MGGRSALMGGTGVALGVDGAAPFLNPATITRIQASRLAFSARLYRYSHTRLYDFHQPGPVAPELGEAGFDDTTVSDNSLHSVPDSVCYFFPAIGGASRAQRLSLCLATTEEQELSLKAQGFRDDSAGLRIDLNQHYDVSWSRFNFGPTWGLKLNDDLAVGASLMIAYSRYKHTILASSVVADDATGAASTASYESVISAYSWDFAPRFGATYRLSDPLSIGLGLTVPLVHLFGGIRETYMNEFDVTRTQRSGDGDFDARPPFQVRFGVGGEWESVRLEADMFLTPGSSEYADGVIDRNQVSVENGLVTGRSSVSAPVRESSDTVVNLALGAEVFVAQRLSLLAGAQTDVNALSELEPAAEQSRVFRTRLDYYRAAFGVCSYTDFGDLMVGLRFDYGTGRASPANTLVAPPALGSSSVRELGFMLVLAGTLNWRSITQAAGDVGDAVRGKGGRPPDEPPEPLQPPKQE